MRDGDNVFMMKSNESKWDKKKKKLARPPTPERLRNIALHYVQKYAATRKSLERVLQNRVRRAAMRNDEFSADLDLQLQLKMEIEAIAAE
jgi:hypothetical protein